MKQKPLAPDTGGMAASVLLVVVSTALVVLLGCRQLGSHQVTDRTPNGCAECHADITRQWEMSAHATAWNDPEFVERTDGRTISHCLPCHAPSPLLEQGPSEDAKLRQEHRSSGVDCVACHAVGCGSYAGSYRSRLGPHGTEQDLTRLPCSSFCGTCHGQEHLEFVSAYVPSAGPHRVLQCVDCHMPGCRSRLTQGHLLSLIHPKRLVHDHSFPVWTNDLIRGAVDLDGEVSAIADDGSVEVALTLTNRGAGHHIPTGKFGHREVRILMEVLDENDRVVGQQEESIMAGSASSLAPGKATPFTLTAELAEPTKAARVRVSVERVNRDRSFRVPLAARQWAIGSRVTGRVGKLAGSDNSPVPSTLRRDQPK